MIRVAAGIIVSMDTDHSALSQVGLFAAEAVEGIDPLVDAEKRVDANDGATKRCKPFEPDAVMLVPPSLDEWLPQNHLARFVAELVDTELDLSEFHAF